MKKNLYFAIFCLSAAAWAASCSTEKSQNEVSKSVNMDAIELSTNPVTPEDEVYASFAIQNTDLRLVNHNGRCTLRYTPHSSREERVEKSLDVGMVGPCGFVGTGNKIIPQHVIYGKGRERRVVFLITGGPPSEEFAVKDHFMPDGCGTWLAKIYVFTGRIEIAWTSDKGPPTCPSRGTDEVLFY